MIEAIGLTTLILSAITIPMSILNYSMLLNEEVRVILEYKVKPFFWSLIVLVLIISLKVIFGCTLLTGIVHSPLVVRYSLTLALTAYFFAYNLGLLIILIENRIRPVANSNVRDMIALGMLLYVFFDKVHIGQYVDYMSYAFLLFLIYIIARLNLYLKFMDKLVEPVDVTNPTKLYIICSYITAIACVVPDINIARSLFFLAMLKAIIAFIRFDKETIWLSKYK